MFKLKYLAFSKCYLEAHQELNLQSFEGSATKEFYMFHIQYYCITRRKPKTITRRDEIMRLKRKILHQCHFYCIDEE